MILGNNIDNHGTREILIGLTKDEIRRMEDGVPCIISRESHGLGCPSNVAIAIVVGETTELLVEALKASGLLTPDAVIDNQAAAFGDRSES